jgi:hypothetical protein
MTKDTKWLRAVDRRALLIRAGGVAASLVTLELFAQELSPEAKQGREVIKEIADLSRVSSLGIQIVNPRGRWRS